MPDRPFHHGNLRAELLDHAVLVLRESGVDGLSLRDLARRAGVSHGAPRSHFVDRQALLDALAVVGFERLTAAVSTALSGGGDLRHRAALVGQAFVDFAVDDAALMELMFQAKVGSGPAEAQRAAGALFTALDASMGPAPTGVSARTQRDRFKMLFAATMQGIASLITSGRVERETGRGLVKAAIDMMSDSELAAQAISQPNGHRSSPNRTLT